MNVFGLSDVGLSREQNEDTCLYELKDEFLAEEAA